jgi:hypothetical protein
LKNQPLRAEPRHFRGVGAWGAPTIQLALPVVVVVAVPMVVVSVPVVVMTAPMVVMIVPAIVPAIVLAFALVPPLSLHFALALMLLIVTLILSVILSRLNEVHRPIAGVVLAAMVAPIFGVPRWDMQIDGRRGTVLRLDNDGLRVDDGRRSLVAQSHLTVHAGNNLAGQHDANIQSVRIT